MLCLFGLHDGVARCLISLFFLACSCHASLIQSSIMVANRQKSDSGVILTLPVLPSSKLVSKRFLTQTAIPSYGTPTVLPITLSVSTIKSPLQTQPRVEHSTRNDVFGTIAAKEKKSYSDKPILPVIFIALGLATFVMIVIVGIFLMNRRLEKLKRAPMENDCQQQVDRNALAQSSSSIKVDSEVDHFYDNHIASSSISNPETIVCPVYATVEFLPRCSIAEDYVNTFRTAGFLEGDRIVYAEIEIPKGD